MNNKNWLTFVEARHDLSRGDSLQDEFVSGFATALPRTVDGLFSERWVTRGRYRCGHNTVQDGNYSAFLMVDQDVPVSPVVVRDLAGRVIHIGMGPERKALDAWAAYVKEDERADEAGVATPMEDLLVRNVPYIVFPDGCRDIASENLELLEQVFMTKFRTLDMSFEYLEQISDNDGLESEAEAEAAMVGRYDRQNLFPYKLRLDTFYQDGWRVPQVQMVYARPGPNAGELGFNLLQDWSRRPAQESYFDFLQRLGGEPWQAQLFAQGCTLMPTFEACNGFVVVDQDFKIEDYWPGRVVEGLHEVTEWRADHAPEGTILEVIRPGYVTAHEVVPAHVVASDGRGYVSPHEEDPLPLLPNLDLPHQRTVANWGATWIPTHPRHFEQPIRWGWDVDSGRFMQMSGPLWDPLHYYYASIDPVVQAYASKPAGRAWLVNVPQAMQERFYPVVAQPGFDVLSYQTLQQRSKDTVMPLSGVRQVRAQDGHVLAAGAGIGYHPLPVEFEYELEPFWSPDLHPVVRNAGLCPEEWQPRLCPVIRPTVGVQDYLAQVDAPDSAPWVNDAAALAEPQDTPLANYPFLPRYALADLEPADVLTLTRPPYLADLAEGWANGTAEDLWPNVDSVEALDTLVPGLHAQVWQQREAGLLRLRFRHSVYRTNIRLYTMAWWYGLSAEQLLGLMVDETTAGAGAREDADGANDVTEPQANAEPGGRRSMQPGEVPVGNVPGQMEPVG